MALLKPGATVRDITSDGTGVPVIAIASTHFELPEFLLRSTAALEMLVNAGAKLDVKNKGGTAALLRRLMEEWGMRVE